MRKFLFLTLLCLIATGLYAQNVLLSEDWENGVNSWTILNGFGVQNQWHVGSATSNGGSNSIYISNTNGTTWDYNRSSYANVYFYKEVVFPAGITSIQVSFDIHSYAESSWDYAQVYLQPATATAPVANSSDTNPAPQVPSGVQLGSNFSGLTYNGWSTQTFSPPTSTWGDTTARLVFVWHNDGSQGNTPAAIDNISVLALSPNDPPLPATIVSPINGATFVPVTGTTLTWAQNPAGNTPTGYDVFLDTDNPPTAQVVNNANVLTYISQTNLEPGTVYYWRVVPKHTTNQDTPTANCPIWSFTTFPDNLVILGNGNEDSYAPVYTLYSFNVSQQIYLKNELAAMDFEGGLITEIGFQANGAVNLVDSHEWRIHMAETELDTFDNQTSWIDPTTMDLAFNGSVGNRIMTNGEWLTITLDTPFPYTGNQNLVIFVNEYTASWESSAYFKGTSTSPNNRTLYNYTDSAAYVPVGNRPLHGNASGDYPGRPDIRPNIMISYIPPATDFDLALISFTGPALFPGAESIFITLANPGNAVATTANYRIDIFDSEDTTIGNELFSFEPGTGNTVGIPVMSSHVFEITPTDYENWYDETVFGTITLVARVTAIGSPDTDGSNDEITWQTTLREPHDLAVSFTATIPEPRYVSVENDALHFAVANNGRDLEVLATDYTVSVKLILNGTAAHTYTVTPVAIPLGESVPFDISFATITAGFTYTPGAEYTIEVTANFTSPGDDTVPANNRALVDAFLFGDITEVGVGGREVGQVIPFYSWRSDSIAQSIYSATELGGEPRSITHINYRFERDGDPVPIPYPVSIYMKNVERTSFANNSDWESGDGFINVVPVYDIPADKIGIFEALIPLTTPFEYSGGDLVVMTYKDLPNNSATQKLTYFQGPTTPGSNVSIYKGSDATNNPFNPANPSAGEGDGTTRLGYKPQTRFGTMPPTPVPGGDLAMTAFTGPDHIPGDTTPMVITVLNRGADLMPATGYSIRFYDATAGLPGSWISNADLTNATSPAVPAIPGLYQSVDISIPHTVYSGWDFAATAVGTITIRAELYLTETITDNNSQTIETELLPKYDIAFGDVTGPGMYPAFAPLKIKLENKGRDAIAAGAYTMNITLTEAPGFLITYSGTTGGTAALAIPVADDVEYLVTAEAIATQFSTHAVPAGALHFNIALVNTPAGEVTTNNTATFTSHLSDFNTDGIVEVGVGGNVSNTLLPFSVQDQDSVVQSIYSGADFTGVTTGLITQIMYKFTRGSDTPQGTIPATYPVSIWMANTATATFATTSSWIAESAFEPVVTDYPLDLAGYAAGTHEIWIPLNTPFLYEGNNLVVMTFKDHAGFMNATNVFFQTNPENSNVSLARVSNNAGNTTVATLIGAAGTQYDYKPQMRFAITTLSASADLSITSFTGPDKIPGTAPMQIIVMNASSQTVAANEYTLKIYEGEEITANLRHTVTGLEAIGPASSKTYTILAAGADGYNGWQYTTASGAMTLKAVIDFTDLTPLNNTATLATSRRPEVDIAFASVTGPEIYPSTAPLVITLENNGRTAITADYAVAISIEGDPIHSIPAGECVGIPVLGTLALSVPAATLNPLLTDITDDFTFTITVTSTQAGEVDTNNTYAFDSSRLGVDAIVEVGIGGADNSANLPFTLSAHDSVTQSIYRAAEFGDVTIGNISQIMYRFTKEDGATIPDPYPVTLYLANIPATERPSGFTATGWVPVSEFTRVAVDIDLALSRLDAGTHDIWIRLTNPFFYTGGDLVVMGYKDHSDHAGTENRFLQTPPAANSNVSLMRSTDAAGNTLAEDMLGVAGTILDYKPQMRFAFVGGGDYGVLSGDITDATNAGISGVTVSQVGGGRATSTSTGAYSVIVSKAADAAPVIFSKLAYASVEYAVPTAGWTPGATGELPTLTHDVTMNSVTPATVTGIVKKADTGAFIGDATVKIMLAETTIATVTSRPVDGAYTIANLYPYTTYAVTATLPSTVTGYMDFEGELYFEPLDAPSGVYTYDIAVEEITKPPLFVTINQSRQMRWFNPTATVQNESLVSSTPTGARVFGSDEFIAASQWKDEALNDKHLRGSYLTAVRFKPERDGANFTLMIWTGALLATPNVNAPNISQQISYTATAGEYNEIVLNTPLLVPSTGQIAIGVKSNNVKLGTISSAVNDWNQFGNKYYHDGRWTTIQADNASFGADNWDIVGVFIAPPPANPVFDRGFASRYNVYRLYGDEEFDEDAPLNATPIRDAALMVTYTDTSLIAGGDYRYGVAAYYEGISYPDGILSAPAFVNTTVTAGQYIVSGTITVQPGQDTEGLTFTLENQTPGQPSPEPVIVVGTAFSFRAVDRGIYKLIVSNSAADNDETYEYPSLITVNGNVTNLVVDVPAAVADGDVTIIPTVTTLRGNYPNPFNPTTTIAFDLARDGAVVIDVYNIKGQRVKSLVNDVRGAGRYNVVWNGDDSSGKSVGSGVYFYRMTADGYTKTQKMVLMK